MYLKLDLRIGHVSFLLGALGVALVLLVPALSRWLGGEGSEAGDAMSQQSVYAYQGTSGTSVLRPQMGTFTGVGSVPPGTLHYETCV